MLLCRILYIADVTVFGKMQKADKRPLNSCKSSKNDRNQEVYEHEEKRDSRTIGRAHSGHQFQPCGSLQDGEGQGLP